MKFIHAKFPNKLTADTALQAVLDEHVPPRDVWVALHEGEEVSVQRPTRRSMPGLNAAVAGSIGLLVGLIVGAFVPPELLNASKGESVALQIGALGAFVGLLIGALRGVGRWRHEVDVGKTDDARGGVLMAVGVPQTRLQQLGQLLRAKGGRRLHVEDRPMLPNTDAWVVARS